MSAASRRSLWPREHGAWVQLLLPLLTALILAEPSRSGVLLAIAALALFLAHEPLLVVLGHRGHRARRKEGARAGGLLLALVLCAGLAGVLGLVEAPSSVWASLAAPLVPAALVAPLVRKRRERSTPGEILAALALAGACLPVGLASGLAPAAAVTVWLLWCAVLVVETLAARGVLAMAKKRNPSRRLLHVSLALGAGVQAALAALALAGVLGPEVPLAFAPALIMALAVNVLPVHARQLAAIGIAMLLGGLVTSGVLVVGLT